MNLFPVSTTLLMAGLCGLVAASVSDIEERLIYNEIVIFVFAIGIALRLVSTPGLAGISLLVCVCLLIVLGQLARFGIIGGGDAKLIAATLLLLPPQRDAWLLAHIALAGGVLSCAYLAARIAMKKAIPVLTSPVLAGPVLAGPVLAGQITQTSRPLGVFGRERAKIAAGEPMPYALAILAGAAYSIASEATECISATSCSL
jgi:prepilin peptidase CpaA